MRSDCCPTNSHLPDTIGFLSSPIDLLCIISQSALQLPVDTWHDAIDHPTLADAILDRLVHNAYRIALRGESMRHPKARKAKDSQG